MERKCTSCAKTKSLAEYYGRKGGGTLSRCKLCIKKQSQHWRNTNLERDKETKRRYYAANREKHKADVQRWKNAHPDWVWHRTPTYNSWRSMLERCRDPNNIGYSRYGGRGITVCDRWDNQKDGSFANFLTDMGERPANRTLDRIDTNGNYEPNNCR